jgi:hypothetical protein
MKIDLCCFWDGLAKYFDLLEDEKGPRRGVTQTLRLPWVVCNVKDWGKYVRRIWGIWKGRDVPWATVCCKERESHESGVDIGNVIRENIINRGKSSRPY